MVVQSSMLWNFKNQKNFRGMQSFVKEEPCDILQNITCKANSVIPRSGHFTTILNYLNRSTPFIACMFYHVGQSNILTLATFRL